MIDLLDPAPKTLVQLRQRKRPLGIEVGQKLFSHRAKVALDFSTPFRLIRWGMRDQHADRCRNPRQLHATKNFGVIDVETNGYATRRDRLSQAIEESIQSLLGIKLGMRDQPAGSVQDGIQEGLHPSAAGALDVGPEQQVGLPDLVTKLRFELLASCWSQQLPRGETALLEKAVQGGRGNCTDAGNQSQFSQQGGAGTVRVLALQSFDQFSQLRREGPRLPAVASGLRRLVCKTTTAITQRPIEQGIDREGGALGIRDLIGTCSNFLRTSSEFSTRKALQN